MKRILTAIILITATVPLAAPLQSAEKKVSAAQSGEDTAVQEVKQLEQRLREASLHGDASFFEKHWAEGYVRTNSFGVLLTREDALKNYKSGVLKYTKLEFDEDQVQSYGDTVVVTARVTLKGKYEDKPLDGVFRHTRVWVKLPDGWKVVAYHASRVDLTIDSSTAAVN